MQLAFVIPAFNEEGLIGRCLESVTKRVKQSGVECEIIVVNNASTDRTKEIAEGFEGVTVVDEFEKGLVYARRAGFNASTAELVANLDADTELPDGWIETVMSSFEKQPELVGLSGHISIMICRFGTASWFVCSITFPIWFICSIALCSKLAR